MYKDVQMKMDYHKNRLLNEYIKHGISPNEKEIKKRLDNINSFCALFHHTDAQSGKKFSTKQFNQEMELAYQDLLFLYQLLHDYTVNEYILLKAYTDTHLDELENITLKYKTKAVQEAQSTSLGKTIFFKHSGFDIYTKNNIEIVNLGPVKVHQSSRIACFIEASNIEPNKVVFGLQNKYDNNDHLLVAPYNYNQDSILIPGELKRNTYTNNLIEGQKINGPVEMAIDKKPTLDNSYVIFSGENKVMIQTIPDTSLIDVIDMPTPLDSVSINRKSYINFYVVGGNEITFRFNKMPTNINFTLENNKVSNLKHIHHFFIECEEDFTFDFELDNGKVFATKERGVVEGDKLYANQLFDLTDYYIEEYETGEETEYHAYVKIINDDGEPIDIQSIIIKELLNIGGDIKW